MNTEAFCTIVFYGGIVIIIACVTVFVIKFIKEIP